LTAVQSQRLHFILLFAVLKQEQEVPLQTFSRCDNDHFGLFLLVLYQRRAYGIGPDVPLDVSPPINGDATHQLALSSLNCD
jgi:hypothetical protein